MNPSSLHRPALVKSYDDRQKGRKMVNSSSSSSKDSMNAAAPNYFGDFLRSCGSPSSRGPEEVGRSSAHSGGVGSKLDGDGFHGTTSIKVQDDDPTALIAGAMYHLSLKEREHAYEDLHGVSEAVQETPELIADALHKMEQCLQQNHPSKPAYDMAINNIPGGASYVRDPKLRLAFLRSDRFDITLATKRFVKFLDWKLKLFGQEKLCQWHIGLDDLDDDTRFMVASGFFQPLPSRDTRGRAILVIAGSYHLRLHRNAQSTLRMVFYIYQCFAEDEANQKSGLIRIPYCLGQPEVQVKSEVQSVIPESSELQYCMPIRIEATHFCTAHTGMQCCLDLMAKSFGVLNRARIRVQMGSHLECEYALLSFGIPSHLLPFTTTSELKTDNHKKWVERRTVKEQELALGRVFSGIDLPNRNDVLLGKGKPLQNHPGNRRLLELSEGYLNEYNQANLHGGRTHVARKIIHEIWHPPSSQNNCSRVDLAGGGGARFLQRRNDNLKSGWWEDVTDEEVLIAKITNAMRGIRKRKNCDTERDMASS